MGSLLHAPSAATSLQHCERLVEGKSSTGGFCLRRLHEISVEQIPGIANAARLVLVDIQKNASYIFDIPLSPFKLAFLPQSISYMV